MTLARQAFWLRVALIGGILAALEIACRAGALSPISIVPPSEMLAAAWGILRSGKAAPDIAFSLENVALASLVSILGGFAIGFLLHAIPRLRRAAEPILSAYYAVPTFVLYPVLIIMFGLGSGPLVVIGALFGIVAMIISTMMGLDALSPALRNTASVLHLNRARRLLHMQLPAASLHLIGGVRLAVAYSVIGVVAGEFILSTSGVGKQIAFAYNDFETGLMYGYLVLLLGFVLAVNIGLQQCENAIRARWAA